MEASGSCVLSRKTTGDLIVSNDVIHWAERALDEPYPDQDFSWVRWQFAAGLVAAGLASSAVVTSAVLLAPPTHSDADQAILIVSAQVEEVNPELKISLGTPSATRVQRDRGPANTKVERGSNPQPGANIPPQAVKVTALRQTDPKKESVEVNTPTPAPTTQAVPPAATPDKAASLAKTETYQATSKNTEKKPVDIASGEKLGIQAILSDGIVLLTGRKVKTGFPLPNGELLVGTDPAKGMAETDRRVLVVTP